MVDEAGARARAEALVRSYCGWRVAPAVREVLTVDSDSAGTLLLPTMRLKELHSLTINGEPVTATDYQWSGAGVLRLTGTVPTSWGHWGSLYYAPQLQGIAADVTHGHDEWPPEIEAVLDALSSRNLQAPTMYVQVGQVRTATGPDGMPVGAGLSPTDRSILDRYRLPGRL